MMGEKTIAVIGTFLIMTLLVSVPGAFAQFGGGDTGGFSGDYQIIGSSSNPQFTQPSFGISSGFNIRDYWSDFNKEDCTQRQDMLLMIPPGGCSPAVVRSDLLEEQNVPVFCKVSSIELNPLIDISKIKSIRFKGEYPKGVQSVSYFPARAAIRSTTKLEASPVVDNVGYLVVVLKGRINEKDMPDFLEGNVTAVIDYDTKGTFGVGTQDFFLNEMSDEDWFRNHKESGFWDGKGYVRVTEIEEDAAVVSIYQNPDQVIARIRLDKGETSKTINLGGYYCSAGMKLRLEDVGYPQTIVKLRVDDQEIWVGKGSKFLDGKCRVVSITLGELNDGKVRISCTGAGSFELRKNPPVPSQMSINGKDPIDVKVGSLIPYVGNKSIYLAYTGIYPGSSVKYHILIASETGTSQLDGIGNFVNSKERIWSNTNPLTRILKLGLYDIISYTGRAKITEGYTYKEQEAEYYTYLLQELIEKYPNKLKNDEESIAFLVGPGAKWDIYGIRAEDKEVGESLFASNFLLKEYYDETIDSYNDLVEAYPNEKDITDNEAWAAKGLRNAGNLAGILNLEKEQKGFYERVVDKYPGSNSANYAENKLKTFRGGLSKESQALVEMNDDSHFISLYEIKRANLDDLSAELSFDVGGINKDEIWGKDSLELVTVMKDGKSKLIPFEITEINEDSIQLKYAIEFSTADAVLNTISRTLVGRTAVWETVTLELNKRIQLTTETSVKLTKTNLNKQAKVRIIPEVRGTRTEADFGFKIGIEKRNIQLSPETTKKLMNRLQKQIKQWTDINEKLGKVVKALKGACFATSAILTIKNFFSGLGGAAQARNEVMTAKGGWNERCRQEAPAEGISVEECLLRYNSKIEESVVEQTKEIEARNKEFDEIYKNLPASAKTSDLFFTESYDERAVTEAYKKSEAFGGLEINKRYNLTVGGEKSIKDVIENHEDDLTVEEMRDLVSYSQDTGSETLSNIRKEKMKELLGDMDQRFSYIDKTEGIRASFEKYGFTAIELEEGKSKVQVMDPVSNNEAKKLFGDSSTQGFLKPVPVTYGNDKANEYNQVDSKISGQEVMVGLKEISAGKYQVEKAFLKDGKTDVTKEMREYYDNIGIHSFTKADASYYRNPYKEKGIVKYYERAPYKGLPALVPFDKENGWYVSTDYVVRGFGKPFEDSGRAVNFWICNVGENGLFEPKRGDICEYYNVGIPSDRRLFGLSPTESRALASKAQNAIIKASRDYGNKEILINGQRYATGIAGDGTTGRCTDFMSPQECSLLFNLCDPVICPASRCDYGGAYRVDDVIQSGIIGSLVLCLPNYPGVKVPVCLSGVHAGIDGWIGVLKSGERCLNESLETGRNIGICDEITSIYMCRFFWDQMVPLLDVAIPRIFEIAQGQNVRGGGEYTTVQSAWDNAQKSIDFFTQEYAVNSIKAFNLRSTEEVGGEICQSFVGGRFPDSADFFDRLTDPDSPVQYSGWFDENILNTATIPPTSHYKVYYHIYAGKDIGAQYVVYLRADASTGLVRSTGDYVVDRGYITRGGQVDEAKDFTAVSGFTKLCISVNGKEDCNFKQVSTSAAFNYIRDSYAAEQASEDDITKSEECVAGKQSWLAFAQPNLQAGAEEFAQPELYKRGIVRVCATNNPGISVDQKTGDLDTTNLKTDRWKEVGYCDDKSIRCWVDTDSVENVLRDNKILLNNALKDITNAHLDQIEKMTEGNAKTAIKDAEVILGQISRKFKVSIDSGSIISFVDSAIIGLEEVSRIGPDNNYKTNALFLKAEIYRKITEQIYIKEVGISSIEDIGKTAAEQAGAGKIVKDLRELEFEYEDGYLGGNKEYRFNEITNDWEARGTGTNWYFQSDDWQSTESYELEWSGGTQETPPIMIIANTFSGGLQILMSKVFGTEGGSVYDFSLFTERVTLTNDRIFKVDGDNYFKYENGEWQFSTDKKTWNNLPRLSQLKGQGFDLGAEIIFKIDLYETDILEEIIGGPKEFLGTEVGGAITPDSLKDFYNLYLYGSDEDNENPFSDFDLGGDTTWVNDNVLRLEDHDFGFMGISGYLNLKLKNDWKGTLRLRLKNDAINWWKDKGITGKEGHMEVELKGGDYLTIDIDKEFGDKRFSFKIKSQGIKGTSQEKISDDVDVEFISWR